MISNLRPMINQSRPSFKAFIAVDDENIINTDNICTITNTGYRNNPEIHMANGDELELEGSGKVAFYKVLRPMLEPNNPYFKKLPY